MVYKKADYLVDLVSENDDYINTQIVRIDNDLKKFGQSKTEHNTKFYRAIQRLKEIYEDAGWSVSSNEMQDRDCRGQIERTYIELFIY